MWFTAPYRARAAVNTAESCSLSRSVSTSLTRGKGSIQLCSVRGPLPSPDPADVQELLCSPSSCPDWAVRPSPSEVSLVLASCQRKRSICHRVCYFSLNSFSGNSIKQVRGPYLTDFKTWLLNVQSLFKHAVMSGVTWGFVHEGVVMKSLFP